MLIRVGEFKKKNGESRKMRFLKISDMSFEQKSKIGLTEEKERKKRVLAEGSETVYDVDAMDFRVFNWNSITTEVVQEEVELNF